MRARTSSAPEMSSSELSEGSWNAVSLEEDGTETREGRLWCAVVEVWRAVVRAGWLAEEEEDEESGAEAEEGRESAIVSVGWWTGVWLGGEGELDWGVGG